MPGNQALLRMSGDTPRLRSSHAPMLQRRCACGGPESAPGECADCRQKSGGELHRAAEGDPAPEYAPDIVHDVLRSPGEPLQVDSRHRFEALLGGEFSGVRLHTGQKASESAAAVGAAAYAVGKQIVFGPGYGPYGSGDSERLLAHELTHVMQWGDQPIPARLPVASQNSAAEREARAHRARAGAHAGSLQRAVRVCDEYRAEDSGAGTPGPGLNVNVSVSGKRADVSARLEVSGADSDAPAATSIQSTIASNWTGVFADGYSISTRPTVSYRAAGASADSAATQIEIVRAGPGSATHTIRRWLVGSRYVSLNLDYGGGNALWWAVAHEFGHLLGLDDHYSEGFLSKVASLFGYSENRSATVDAGYENNIMGVDYGSLESRNVQDLIALYTQYTCVRSHMESPL
jgi:hypothetical protein